MTHKRGNPNWWNPKPAFPAPLTEFEMRVKQLKLTAETYTSSAALRAWCEQNKDRVYIPEWLLKEWRLVVDANLSNAA